MSKRQQCEITKLIWKWQNCLHTLTVRDNQGIWWLLFSFRNAAIWNSNDWVVSKTGQYETRRGYDNDWIGSKTLPNEIIKRYGNYWIVSKTRNMEVVRAEVIQVFSLRLCFLFKIVAAGQNVLNSFNFACRKFSNELFVSLLPIARVLLKSISASAVWIFFRF